MTGVMNKIPIANIALLVLLLPSTALAQAEVTEIMYDPAGTDSGHEWIELYNAGTSPIPLSSWKLYEGDANHNIIAASGGKSLAPRSFAVIAQSAVKFEADYPDFSGELFHSAFSLDNAGATIALRNASSTIAGSAAYDSASGALGDGNSLQRPPDDTAQFSPHVPTPGAAMSSNVVPAKVKAAVPVKAPQKPKTTNDTDAKPPLEVSHPYPDTGNPDGQSAPSSQTASAATSNEGDSYWWLALGALVVLATGAIVASKHFKKTEWDIVEETPEDV